MSSCSLCKTTTGRFEAAAEVANVLHVSSACMSTVDKESKLHEEDRSKR